MNKKYQARIKRKSIKSIVFNNPNSDEDFIEMLIKEIVDNLHI